MTSVLAVEGTYAVLGEGLVVVEVVEEVVVKVGTVSRTHRVGQRTRVVCPGPPP